MQDKERNHIFSTLLENGWLWLLITAGSVLILAALYAQEIKSQQAKIIQNNLALSLVQVRDTMEADLAMGLLLHDSRRVQSLLVEQAQQNAWLHSLAVVGRNGAVISSSHRAAIGTALPAALSAALLSPAASGSYRHYANEDGLWIAMPLRSAHGEIAGYAMLSALPAHTDHQQVAGMVWLDVAKIVLVLVAVCVMALLLVHTRQAQHDAASRLRARVTQAEQALAQHQRSVAHSFEALDRMEHRE